MEAHSSKESRVYFFFLALVVVFVSLYTTPRLFIESLWPDEALYAWLAKNADFSFRTLFSNEFIERQPPLFPVILSLAQSIHPFSDVALRVISFVLGVGGIVASFYAGKWIGGSDFIAAFCAMGVGFSFCFLSVLPRILSDGALMMFFLLFMLSLFKALKSPSWQGHVLVGLLGVCLILLKWSGSLCLPIMLGCYWFQPHSGIRSRAVIPAAMVLAVLLLLLLNNFVHLGSVFPDVTALQGAISNGPPWFYLEHFDRISPFPSGSLFVFFGLFIIWKNRHPQRALITTWFLLTFFSVSLAGEKNTRYAFLFLPSATLLIAVFCEYLIAAFFKTEFIRRSFKIGVCLCFFIMALGNVQAFELGPKDHSYTGFREAGEYIRSLRGTHLNIFADSQRALRYYSGIEYKKYGGYLSSLPRSEPDLKTIVAQSSGTVAFVIDSWEYTQPDWAYPLTPEKQERIEGLGFRLARVVEKPVFFSGRTEGGAIFQPVIWVFIAGDLH
jgi:hypothetical protein